MTDRSDRGLAPHAQADPDMYLHIVERRPDGIVVRGAKAHQTGIINSHEVIVMPTCSMGPGRQRLRGFLRGAGGYQGHLHGHRPPELRHP